MSQIIDLTRVERYLMRWHLRVRTFYRFKELIRVCISAELNQVDSVHLLVVCQREHEDSRHSKEQVVVIAFPRHQNSVLEVDDLTRLLQMGVYPSKVVGYHCQTQHLLPKRDADLIELHLVHHLLVKVPNIFTKADAVDQCRHIRALEWIHIVLATLNSCCLSVTLAEIAFLSFFLECLWLWQVLPEHCIM